MSLRIFLNFLRFFLILSFLFFSAHAWADANVESSTNPSCEATGARRVENTPTSEMTITVSGEYFEGEVCYNEIDDDADGHTDYPDDPDCPAPGERLRGEDGNTYNIVLRKIQVSVFQSDNTAVVDSEGNVVGYQCSEQKIDEYYVDRRYAGCFSFDTEIVMADGTKKPMYALRKGDLVLNPKTARGVKIKKIVAGTEDKPLIEISLGEKILKVTKDHPMYVERKNSGLKRISLDSNSSNSRPDFKVLRAEQLTVKDRVLVADGGYRQITNLRELPLRSGETVFNLELAADSSEPGEHMLLTGSGIISGDLLIQKALKNAP